MQERLGGWRGRVNRIGIGVYLKRGGLQEEYLCRHAQGIGGARGSALPGAMEPEGGTPESPVAAWLPCAQKKIKVKRNLCR